MDVLHNIFFGNRRRTQTTSSISSSNSGSMRYKWPRRHKRENTNKKVFFKPVENVNSPLGLLCVRADDACAICAGEFDNLYTLEKCGHQACLACWRTFVSSRVSSFAMAHITCLTCDRHLPRALIVELLKPTASSFSASSHNIDDPTVSTEHYTKEKMLYQRYEDFLLHQCLLKDKHTRWCPRGCGYALIAHGYKACPRIECPHPDCNGRAFCYKCRGPWNTDVGDHVCSRSTGTEGAVGSDYTDNQAYFLSRLRRFLQPFTAEPTPATAFNEGAAKPTSDSIGPEGFIRRLSERRSSLSQTIPIHPSDVVTELDNRAILSSREGATPTPDGEITEVVLDIPDGENGQVKPCPCCQTYLLKLDDGSCNHMHCFICGCEFCWLCLREVRDTHYLSPSGCTFWGRQRWSFKRRLLSMLMIAIGTPIFLTLIVAVAFVLITLTFPGYLVHVVKSKISGGRCKRLFLKTLIFLGGLCLSPVIAALVILCGVPLVLIYVYIYMPIALLSGYRRGSKKPSSSGPAVDPEIGFKLNWSDLPNSPVPEIPATVTPDYPQDTLEE